MVFECSICGEKIIATQSITKSLDDFEERNGYRPAEEDILIVCETCGKAIESGVVH